MVVGALDKPECSKTIKRRVHVELTLFEPYASRIWLHQSHLGSLGPSGPQRVNFQRNNDPADASGSTHPEHPGPPLNTQNDRSG